MNSYSIRSSQRGLSMLPAVFIAFAAVMILVALWGWKDLYTRYLERELPEIVFSEAVPRGVGISPVSVPLLFKDSGSGLDEVVVRVRQRQNSREILRRALRGAKEATVSVDFSGEQSGFEEGLLQLEVKAFDRSFWSNANEKTLELTVDYRRPKISVLSTQHNARHGGSQLVFYEAFDENLAVSGVKVGSQTFLGFPASGLDKGFEEKNLFVAIYAIDQRGDAAPSAIRLFAQDEVGNAVTTSFNNKVLDRGDRKVVVNLTDEFMHSVVSELATRSQTQLSQYAREAGEVFVAPPSGTTTEALQKRFALVLDKLSALNDAEIVGLVRKSPRFERYWTGAFQQPAGVVSTAFGDRISYRYEGVTVGERLAAGYEFNLGRDGDVTAAADGIVAFSSNIGVYGRVVGIDHGLGVLSLYGRLDTVAVNPGDVVTVGQEIGAVGRTGFARGTQLYFEVRVQGVPVDPREWWDGSWMYAHVTDKANEVKRSLGLQADRPL